MKWLATSKEISAAVVDLPLQSMSLASDLIQLSIDIPIQAQLVSEDEGLPSATQRWCCQIDDRFVVIERELYLNIQAVEQVAIYTTFVHTQQKSGDWKILLELRQLPASIILTRPLYIESRTTAPSCVVYRPDPRGWSDPVYCSWSHADAQDFLLYLKQDTWNEICYIGEPSPRGQWSIILSDVDQERVLGAYPEKNLALKVACEISLRQLIKQPISVRDLSEPHSVANYQILSGRVLDNSCGS